MYMMWQLAEFHVYVLAKILDIICMYVLLHMLKIDFHILGMLSKSRGQILRVAATLHVLFNMHVPQVIPQVITEESLKAATNFVETCNQHLAYLSGRGLISDAIETLQELQKG